MQSCKQSLATTDYVVHKCILGSGEPLSYRTNYWLNVLLTNYRHIVYEMIIGKFQLIAANVT